MKVRVNQKAFIGDQMIEPGCIVEVPDGTSGPQFEPVVLHETPALAAAREQLKIDNDTLTRLILIGNAADIKVAQDTVNSDQANINRLEYETATPLKDEPVKKSFIDPIKEAYTKPVEPPHVAPKPYIAPEAKPYVKP